MNSSLTSPPVVGDGRGGLHNPLGSSRENDSAFARYLIERAKLRLALARADALKLGTYLDPAAYAPEKGAVLPPCSGGPTDAELSARGSASFSSQLVEMRAERLCLLTDIHKAARGHRATAGLKARLKSITARLAAMEALV